MNNVGIVLLLVCVLSVVVYSADINSADINSADINRSDINSAEENTLLGIEKRATLDSEYDTLYLLVKGTRLRGGRGERGGWIFMKILSKLIL